MLVCVKVSFIRIGEEKACEYGGKVKAWSVWKKEYAVFVIVTTAVMIVPVCVVTDI